MPGHDSDDTIKLPVGGLNPCTPEELLRRRAEGDDSFLLLDVRTSEELELARLRGVEHIPMGELSNRLPDLDPWREREIVVMCHHGVRSEQVRVYLSGAGFTKARNLAGGIDAVADADPSVPKY